MSTLKLSLHKEYLGSEITHGVVARVHNFVRATNMVDAGLTENLPASYRDVVIPAGRDATISLDVTPGHHRIQAFLPSGQILQEDREIADGEEVTVRFDPGALTREWMSWQRFDDNAPEARAFTEAAPVRRSSRPRLKNLVTSILGDVANVLRQAPALAANQTGSIALTLGPLVSNLGGALAYALRGIPDLIGGNERGASVSVRRARAELNAVSLWEGLTDLDDPQSLLRESGSPAEPDDVATRIDRTQQEGAVALWRVTRVGDQGAPAAWLLLEAADSTEIARLPLPWLDTHTGQFAEVEALVDESPSRSGARLSLTVRDATLGGLLAYLGSGCAPAARVLLDSLDQEGLITQTIMNKETNPLAACAAAYAGLALFEPEERERWDSWLPNIMNRYSWLPDGAIVHARRMIMRPYGELDQENALAALKTAFRAGIPYFSTGVQHLRDGLMLYAHRDTEAKQMLETVSRLARRVDNGQVFTVIRYPKD